MPKTILVLVFLLLFFMAGSSVADVAKTPFEQRCERDMKPMLNVAARIVGFQIDNRVSSRVLNNRSMHNHAGQKMLGMTALQSRTEVQIDAPALADGGLECVAPRVTVDLQFPPIEVFIAREFNPASCSYREILAHEMRHVQLYREQLPKVADAVRAALETHFAQRPLYAAAGQGIERLQDEVDNWLRPLIQAELARIELSQQAMDTREESARLSLACQGELAENLGNRY